MEKKRLSLRPHIRSWKLLQKFRVNLLQATKFRSYDESSLCALSGQM